MERASAKSITPTANKTSAPASLQPAPGRLRHWLGREVETLYPGSFALVMATGIISNALYFEDYRTLSDGLFAFNAVAYVWLVGATLLRALRFSPALWADLINPRLVFSFFTIVAGTDVLGLASTCAATARWRWRCGCSRSDCGSS